MCFDWVLPFRASPDYLPTLTVMQIQQTPAATMDTLVFPEAPTATSEGVSENVQCNLEHKFDSMEHIHSIHRGQPLL